MQISFNKFNQLETPALTVCNPNSEATIMGGKVTVSSAFGILTGAKKISLTPNFNSQWELSFEYSDSSNRHIHSLYNKLEKGYNVYVSDVGYFIIDDYAKHSSDERNYKTLSCHSIDKEIANNTCPLLDEGSYYFYTKGDREGIIQKQMALLPKWKLGFVSDGLKEKTAYFDGENKSNNAYEFLWNEIEEAYECVIDVDLISRTLSFYSLEEYAAQHQTDIHLSKSNDLREVVIEAKDDDCFTTLSILGDNDLEVVWANPNGSRNIYCFDHVLGKMSTALSSAVTKWKEKFNASITPYQSLNLEFATERDKVSDLKKDLDILNTEMDKLKIDRDSIIHSTQTDSAKKTDLDLVNKRISAKQSEINAKKIAITKAEAALVPYQQARQKYIDECSLDVTAKDLDGNTIFTQDLLNELSAYIKTAEYTDEYITQTDDMSQVEIFEQSKKLFERAQGQLEKLSTQSYTFSVDNNSFLFSKKFERFSQQLVPGAIVYLETEDDRMEQVHLTNFTIDYDNKSVNFTFGNKYDKNDIKALYDDVFGNVKTSAAQIKYLKNIINDQQRLINSQQNWINNAFTLTKNHFLASGNQAVIIDNSGYWGKRQSTDKDGNLLFDTHGNPIYDNEQIGIVNNCLAFTTDNWNSLSTAIGKIYLYHDDETGEDVFKYGVAGDVILGKLFIGQSLGLYGGSDGNGNYAISLDHNGLVIVNDGTRAGLTIKDANGNKQFYADDKGSLWLSGNINASGGTLAGWTIGKTDIYKAITENGVEYKTTIRAGTHSETAAFFVETKQSGKDSELQFYVTYGGHLMSKKGWIGGWNISSRTLYSGDYNTANSFAGMSKYGAGYAFWAGGNNGDPGTQGSYKFYVSHDGRMVAQSADITGKITATSGSVGGWNIDKSQVNKQFTSGGHTYRASMQSSNNTDTAAFLVQKDGANQFYVTYGGKLMAQNADIKGTLQVGSNISVAKAGSSAVSKLGGLFLLQNPAGNGAAISTANCVPGSVNTVHSFLWFVNDIVYLGTVNSAKSGAGVYMAGANGQLGGTWSYMNGSSGSLSDARMKYDVIPMNDKYSILFDRLKPCLYKYKQGTSGRSHIGFIAQEVESAIDEAGLTGKDAALVTDVTGIEGMPDDVKMLRYEEIIGMLVREVQILKSKVS